MTHCQHGRPAGVPCPHCLGLDGASFVEHLEADLERVTGERDSLSLIANDFARRHVEANEAAVAELREALDEARAKVAGLTEHNKAMIRGANDGSKHLARITAGLGVVQFFADLRSYSSTAWRFEQLEDSMDHAREYIAEMKAKVAGLTLSGETIRTLRTCVATEIRKTGSLERTRQAEAALAELNRYAEALGGGK